MVPEKFGGVGLGYLDAALISEALGAACAPSQFIATSVMFPAALLTSGTKKQQEHWLPKVAAGEVNVGIGLSENASLRDSKNIIFSNGALTGSTRCVMAALDASAYLVADSQGTMHIVDATEVETAHLVTIDRTRSLVELNFDGVPSEVLSGSQSNINGLSRTIDAGRLMLAADTLGAAKKMLHDSIEYAKERYQFGRQIGSFQAVKHMCSEMAAEIEPSLALFWYAGHALDTNSDDSRVVACQSKSHSSDVGLFVSRKAIEIHGGMGMTDLLGLHYWFKRIGLNRQLLGSPEIVRDEAAKLQSWC